MVTILRILFGSRRAILEADDLPLLCESARKLRKICAAICVTAFLIALVIVLGNRTIPFEWIPPALALLLFVFISSASLASRFGRLTDAKKNVNYARRIGHLIEINPLCARYEKFVKQQDRPFTRLDLEELGAIHIRSQSGTTQSKPVD